MTAQTIEVGEVSPELVEQAGSLLSLAISYAIASPEMREAASTDRRRVKALLKAVDEQEKSITRPINEGLKRVRDMFRRPKEWLQSADDALEKECLRWDGEQRREAARLAAEAAAKADEERKRLTEAAEREAAAGHTETAAAIVEAAAFVAPTPVTLAPAKMAGEATREIWTAELVDIVAVCRGVVEGRISPEAVQINQTFWNGLARSFKKTFDFPGMRAVPKSILASRSE